MKKNTQDLLIVVIKDTLKKLGLRLADDQIILDLPADHRFGDLATNCAMRLARSQKKPPFEIANILIEALKKDLKGPLAKYIKDIKVEGAGFVNFYFQEAYFQDFLRDLLLNDEKALKIDAGKKKKVMIEFVSANPTGALSVAHARQAAVGDALANILEFLNFRVTREYYLNDEGNQINILGRSVELRQKELVGEKIEFPEDHYQGDYIYDIAREVKSKKGEGETIGDFAADRILNIIKKELEDFGVKFDVWYSQKSLGSSGKIEKYLAELKKKGYLYESEGALWFKSTSFGDDKDRVVKKSDGAYTYLAPDIAYHQEKYKRGFQWLINMWGPDHHGYISRLKASVAAFGHDPDSLSVIIVQLATIFRNGQPVQMSTRRGQYITLREVLDEVGADAARFFFMMRRTSSHLDFDLETAKKQSKDNPVFYVQYAHARICSILNSVSEKINPKKIDFSLLKEKEEVELFKKLSEFSSILNICVQSQDPYMLTVYLTQVAEDFHKFYDNHRVLGQEANLTQSRLALLSAARKVIACGLKLLGVSQPEKM